MNASSEDIPVAFLFLSNTNLSNNTNYKDFYIDFSLDFERSDPSNNSSLKRGIERILVGILVEDFYRTRIYRITRIII